MIAVYCIGLRENNHNNIFISDVVIIREERERKRKGAWLRYLMLNTPVSGTVTRCAASKSVAV